MFSRDRSLQDIFAVEIWDTKEKTFEHVMNCILCHKALLGVKELRNESFVKRSQENELLKENELLN